MCRSGNICALPYRFLGIKESNRRPTLTKAYRPPRSSIGSLRTSITDSVISRYHILVSIAYQSKSQLSPSKMPTMVSLQKDKKKIKFTNKARHVVPKYAHVCHIEVRRCAPARLF